MTKRSLREFIRIIEKEDDLIRIRDFVNTDLEITEITDRISKKNQGGKALLFENNGSSFPVLMNLFGSMNRMCKVLGVNHLDEVGELMNELMYMVSKPRNGFFQKLKMIPFLNQIAGWMPRVIDGKGICQEIIHHNPDLGILPVLKCWPYDGGKFITLPIVITKDPVSGLRNAGMYRMQIISKNETGMHWQKYKTGRNHFEKYKTLNQKMPIAVAIGGDPVYTYAATAPLPENIDEFILAGFLRKQKVKLVKCLTQDIEVPSDADFIIEGYIDPDEELFWEGPFGDHTGFYSLADWFPKMHVTCITHKKDAVYPATIVGQPPMEDAWIAKATERIFLPPIRLTLSPETEDMVLPFEGVAHNIALVKVKSLYEGQGTRVMHAFWGAGQMAFNKILILVRGDVDLSDYFKMGEIISKNIDVSKDVHISEGVLDELDHASDKSCYGGKICFDASNKVSSEVNLNYEKVLVWKEMTINKKNEIPGINTDLVKSNIAVAIIGVNKKENIDNLIQEVVDDAGDTGIKFLIFVENSIDIYDYSMLTWIVSANIDPKRDCNIYSEIGILSVDATRKIYKGDQYNNLWPNIVCMDEKTIDSIDNLRKKIENVEIPDSPSKKLKNLNLNEGAVAEKQA